MSGRPLFGIKGCAVPPTLQFPGRDFQLPISLIFPLAPQAEPQSPSSTLLHPNRNPALTFRHRSCRSLSSVYSHSSMVGKSLPLRVPSCPNADRAAIFISANSRKLAPNRYSASAGALSYTPSLWLAVPITINTRYKMPTLPCPGISTGRIASQTS